MKPRLFIKHFTTNREQRETRKTEREEEKTGGLTVAGVQEVLGQIAKTLHVNARGSGT